jgi:hypothetical protein
MKYISRIFAACVIAVPASMQCNGSCSTDYYGGSRIFNYTGSPIIEYCNGSHVARYRNFENPKDFAKECRGNPKIKAIKLSDKDVRWVSDEFEKTGGWPENISTAILEDDGSAYGCVNAK